MSDAAPNSPAPAEFDGLIVCNYCHDNVPSLMSIEVGMKLRLKQEAQLASVPDRVCEGCMKILAKMIAKGTLLRSEQQAKEQNRLTLWRNRVQLVKQAKQHLSQKNFTDAAVSYEKYLRVLEIVYETKPGELSPDLFKNQARAQEVTVIASVYWDLMRIYDTHTAYKERQYKAAHKLAEFVRFTPVFPHIMRKAESQKRQAKNPDAFLKLLKLSNSSRPRCFIATAAFDSPHDPVIEDLCAFRDQCLRQTRGGRRLIALYYRYSPSVAAQIDKNPALKPFIRAALTRIAKSRFIRKRLNL